MGVSRVSAIVVLAAGLGLLAVGAGAQTSYPSAPIRVIIPLAPGGAIDVMVRALGRAFEQRTGHGFVVESRAGANTIIAANACKAAPPDGATICLLSRSSVSINPALYRNLSYDPIRDFEPITNLAFAHQVLILNKNVPVSNFKELVEYSKRNPDKLNFGSFGVGGDTHLVQEWLKHETGARMSHIPYKGASEAMLAFKSGDIQMIYLIVGNPDIARQINEGEVKGLLVPGSKRNPLIPGVPSFAETGLSPDETAFETWFGMFAPKGTPAAIVQKLNAELSAIVRTPEFANQYLLSKGFSPVGNASHELARFIVEDQKKGRQLVEISGAKLEQ
ncbi:MAG: tripartite tricarboxylate transporter substrate binding protein [Hyphomicrobiales bacterium]|nr:tripartite tricarboxylate transporter substrate binding protein [Hyphomicrobiales bacterium]